jgi:hypothetical protein
MLVQLGRLVVQREEPDRAAFGDAPGKAHRFEVWPALVEHAGVERIARELARRVEHREVEILRRRDPALFPVPDDLAVPAVEVRPQVVQRGGRGTLLAVPPVGSEHAPDIEEHVRERGLHRRA